MMIENRLSGKVAIVTGAGQGMGKDYALRLARLGACIVAVDRDLSANTRNPGEIDVCRVADAVRTLGGNILEVELDITRSDAAVQIVERALQAFGRIDILVNNAGGALTDFQTSLASQVSPEDLEKAMSLNFTSVVRLCQRASEEMKALGEGTIVNVGSIGALSGNAHPDGYLANYFSAKAAVMTYTRYLAAELGPHGIRVNCLVPGIIATPRVAALAETRGLGASGQEQLIPLRRLGTPADTSGVLEFLVTDLSQFVTGQCISVCGGMSVTKGNGR